MSALSQLSPQPLWDIFAKICSIPHPSYHEEALAQHIIAWAAEKGFHTERDQVGNILIRKPATPGMEKRRPVVLQAHLDMVPQKNSDTVHDFAHDPIQPYIDGDWVKARGTTLGADNGIGMSSALAVLSEDSIAHGPLEVLLTMTEEAGMEGAFGLQPDWLQAEVMINTDSETNGEIYTGCAGGIDFATTLQLQRSPLPQGYLTYKLTLKGLKGGHSGCDIHLGLGNANKLLTRFLFDHVAQLDAQLLDLRGGTLRNAIPREAFATLAIPDHQVDNLHAVTQAYLSTLQNELGAVEKNLTLLLEPVVLDNAKVLAAASQARLLALLNAMPNGVVRMSDSVPGVVETSLNLGVITMDESSVAATCLVRSLVDSSKEGVVSTLHALGQLAGAETVASGSYPGWQPDNDSAMLKLVAETYQTLFNQAPDIQVIHAGLECGLFKNPYPNMDMVSIGPTIRGPHSPNERVFIPGVAEYWQLLLALLQAIPEQVE